jgi:TPR repeat protein
MYKIIGLALLVFCAAVCSQTLTPESNKAIAALKTELKTEFTKVITQAKEQNIPLYALNMRHRLPKRDMAALGVIFEPAPEGLQILSIRPNSAASMSNLTTGMLITHINGLSVTSQSNKTLSHLFNNLMAIDTLILKIADIATPLTVDLAKAAQYIPAYQLQVTSEETNTAQSNNTSETMQKTNNLLKGVKQNIRQRLAEIAEFETSAGKVVDSFNFELADSSNDKLSYKLIVGRYPDYPYSKPQLTDFNDGRMPALQPCNTEQCRKTYIHYLSLHSENTGLLGRLRNAQFVTAGYGTQQHIRIATSKFETIAKFSDLPYANVMAGKLLLEHKNQPISASVFLRRAVKGENPDPEALRLLSSIYSNTGYDVIMAEEAERYVELALSYPMPEFSLSAEEFMARELAQFPENKSRFESRYRASTRPRNEVIQLNGVEGVYPYLVLKDLPNCQSDKCQHHFKSYFIVNKSQSSSNQLVTQMRLGEMYKAGYGIEPNLVRAMSYFENAAKSDIHYAQHQFATIAFTLKKQIDYAKTMLERAAEAGYPAAMVSLRSQFELGEYRDKDLKKASYWRQQYRARSKVKSANILVDDDQGISTKIINQLQGYKIDLDELFEVESRVLSKATRYRNGRVFELPLTYEDKTK